MNKTLLLNIIIGLLFTNCFAQNKRIENEIMECLYQSYADNGVQFKQLIFDYEKLLVDENILEDTTGKSYRNILQTIADENEFSNIPSKLFLTELQKIEMYDVIKREECQKLIMMDSSLYNLSKMKELEKAVNNVENSKNIYPHMVAREVLDVLSNEDFELDFYKLRTFFLFEIANPVTGIGRVVPELKETEMIEYDYSKAINIYLDHNSQIFVDKEKVSLVGLKKLINDYESKNKSESIILLKTERETLYNTYIEVENAIIGEIRSLRKQLALEKYNIDFDSLTEIQKTEIKNIYPIKIID